MAGEQDRCRVTLPPFGVGISVPKRDERKFIVRTIYRKALVALAATLALGALASASASAALPEFEGPFPNKFTFTASNTVTVMTEGSTTLHFSCTSSTAEGSITEAHAGTATLKLHGCVSGTGAHCTTSGLVEGEIKTGSLPIAAVYTKLSPKEVGIDFNYNQTTTFASFSCGFENPVVIRHSIIAKVTPINTKTSTYTLTFSQSGGFQNPSRYINEHEAFVSAFPEISWFGGPYFSAGLGNGVTLTTEKETKIKA